MKKMSKSIWFFFFFYFLSPLLWVEKVLSRTGYKNKQYETRSYFPELVTRINLLGNSKKCRDMERQELSSWKNCIDFRFSYFWKTGFSVCFLTKVGLASSLEELSAVQSNLRLQQKIFRLMVILIQACAFLVCACGFVFVPAKVISHDRILNMIPLP